MNNYKKLTTKEENEIFENVWDSYSKNRVVNKLHMYIAIAAMLIFSLVIISQENDFLDNKELVNYSEIINYDLYEEEKEDGIYSESLRDLSKEDLDNILTQL